MIEICSTMHPTIDILNNTFTLHPCGALYWEDKKTLLIADVHLGKISHFRKYGSAVPTKAISQNFKQLSKTVDYFNPDIICFLGDLFHSSLNVEWKLFEDWVSSRKEKVVLVAGNHDIISPAKYDALGIKIYSEVVLEPFLLTHHPEEREDYFNFSGHIHPGIRLGGLGKQMLQLSCFFKTQNQMILPAFGNFTGNYYLDPQEGDEVFAVTKNEVIQVC